MYATRTYTENDLIKIGARYHNTKRNYLLIDPLQGKHIPVSPSESLTMIRYFGEMLKTKYPETKLVVGFAETATAVGAGIATVFPDCHYICTTRESFPNHDKIEFLEEHSHAAEQILITDNLSRYIHDTETVIFVDDELSTGKTMRNILSQLTKTYPELSDKNIVVASIINRVDEKNIKLMSDDGITCEALLFVPNINYTEQVNSILPYIESARDVPSCNDQTHVCEMYSPYDSIDPRIGININDYTNFCNNLAEMFTECDCDLKHHITIIGTEECMYPAMIIGESLESQGHIVTTHSTTRSPIGIINSNDYPIHNGYKLPSFYDNSRQTFIYNMTNAKNETAIIVSDSKSIPDESVNTIVNLFTKYEANNIIIIRI